MPLQYSTKLRNAQMSMVLACTNGLTITSSAITGTAPGGTLKIRTGTLPANCAAADTGTVLATFTLSTSWLNAAASGAVTLASTISDTSADATGVAGHFRIYDSSNACQMQGNITSPGGGGALILDNTSITAGQIVDIGTFTLTAANS